MKRERQKEIVKMFKAHWEIYFELRSKYIGGFEIPHHLIAPELIRRENQKMK